MKTENAEKIIQDFFPFAFHLEKKTKNFVVKQEKLGFDFQLYFSLERIIFGQ